jgi:hypothetical protein
MKRIMIIATLVALAQTVAGISPMPQTSSGPTTLRRIEVNTKTITALAPGKNYVVDLTQRGVIYEFSPQAGQIDFNRVRVRTARGEVEIGSFLETNYLIDKLAGFKYKSQAFSLATRTPGTLQNPQADTTNFKCSAIRCACNGTFDCNDLIFNTSLCGGPIFCAPNPATGEKVCVCDRHSGS